LAKRTPMDQVLFSPVPVSELLAEITNVVRREIAATKPAGGETADDLLSREEAAKLLRITLPTLRERTKEGRLRGYRMGARVLYRRSEVIASLRGEVSPDAPRP
jgi:excisionase family DNA binding protein